MGKLEQHRIQLLKEVNMRIRYYLIIMLSVFILSCRDIPIEREMNPISKKQEVPIIVDLAKDSIFLNENAKGLVILKKSFFSPDAKMVVVLENNDETSLKSDLSNEYNIPIIAFFSLENDSLNQFLFSSKDYNFRKTSAVGRMFTSSGDKLIRGYVMEYSTEEPPMEIIYDKDKVKKTYFEKKIYVKDSLPLK